MKKVFAAVETGDKAAAKNQLIAATKTIEMVAGEE